MFIERNLAKIRQKKDENMSKKWRKNLIIILPTFLLCALAVFSSANAAFNEEINHQGKLFDNNDSAVEDGEYMMRFELFTGSTGGTAVWTEDRTTTPDLVTVRSGLFSVMLGDVASLSAVDFNRTLYLQISVGTSSLETMTPRKILGAVPASFTSKQLDGKTWESPGALGGTTASTAIFTNATSTGNQYVGGLLSVIGDASFGEITSGTWSGDIISTAFGGTGLNTSQWTGVVKVVGGTWATTTIDLSTTTDLTGVLLTSFGGSGTSTLGSTGSLVYSNGTTYDFLTPSSTSGLILQMLSSNPTWVSTSSLGYGTVGYGTTGQMPYYAADGTVLTATSDIFVSSSGYISIGTTTFFGAKLSIQTTGTTDILNLFETGGQSVFTVLENGNIGIGTTTPQQLLDVNGNVIIRGDISTTNNEFYYNSSTGQTQIVSAQLGNMNFPDNAGRVGFGNMYVSTTLGTQMEIGLGGFNGDYPISIYAESLSGYGYATRTLWINSFGFLSYGNVSSTGNGESKNISNLVTYTAATTSLFTYQIESSSTIEVSIEVHGLNQYTGSTTVWAADMIGKRWNNAVTLEFVNVKSFYHNNSTTDVFASTTATGIAINVVGDTTTTWKIDSEFHTISP